MRPVQTTRAFGAAIRRARLSQHLSQAELAARAGVGRQWLSELERGKRTAELGRALAVVNALGLVLTIADSEPDHVSKIDLDDLLDGRPHGG